MSWEFKENRDPRDWTRVLWIGIGLMVVLMVVALMMTPDDDPLQSTAFVYWIEIKFPISGAEARANAGALCQEIHDRIISGEKFGDLAREFSTAEASGAKGGELGLVHMGEMPDSLDDYIWTCPLNTVSDVISTGAAFFLLKVVDRNISEADQYEIDLHRKVFEGTIDEETPPKQ